MPASETGRNSEALVFREEALLWCERLPSDLDLQRRPDLAKRISQIDVADAHDAALLLKGDTALVRVGESHFADRIQSYLDLAPALRERIPAIDYVDLRFDERVYVRPLASGTPAHKTF